MKNPIKFTLCSAIVVASLLWSLAVPGMANSPDEWITFPLFRLSIQANASETEEDRLTSPPVRISIPSLAVNLALKPAKFANGDWEFFSDAASFWQDSAHPGEEGNVVIYAHRKTLFAPLSEAKIGERVILATESGKFTYTIVAFRVVSPSQIEVFSPTEDEQLTLLTCTNDNDSDRLVIISEPASSFSALL